MICPNCNTGVRLELEECFGYPDKEFDSNGKGFELAGENCPECSGLIVVLRFGAFEITKYHGHVTRVEKEEIIFPKNAERPIPLEVPEPYKIDYLEAFAVLSISAKASAALSRRILQTILREEFGIQKRTLAQEIDDFISLSDVPTYLNDAIDAIRNIGNFAAHPLKDTNTGEIVAVEPGEAEWLIEVLDALFDFTFVQPKRLQERKEQLNKKLKKIGKPEMKG